MKNKRHQHDWEFPVRLKDGCMCVICGKKVFASNRLFGVLTQKYWLLEVYGDKK